MLPIPLPSPPAPLYHHSPSCLYGFGYSWSFPGVESYSIYSFVPILFRQHGVFRCPKKSTQGSRSILCAHTRHPSLIEGHRVTLPSWQLGVSCGELGLPTVQLSVGPCSQPFMVCILKMELLAHVVVKFWDYLDFSLLISSKRKKNDLMFPGLLSLVLDFMGSILSERLQVSLVLEAIPKTSSVLSVCKVGAVRRQGM